jgi:hypothetical protein
MSIYRNLFLMMGFAILTSIALANKGDIVVFGFDADLALFSCETEAIRSINGQENTLDQCVIDKKSELKKTYEKAQKEVKKASAKAALKEYYIAVLSALQGINPEADERKMNYEKRQVDNKIKVKELWTRFEVEN